MKEPVQFFLRCDPDARYFYVVQFYDTKARMRAAIAELKGTRVTRHERCTEAACLRFQMKKSAMPKLDRKHDLVGTLFFTRGNAPMPVVVHELTHAAIGWARRAKVNPLKRNACYRRDPEEKFVRTLQYLVEQFYEQAPRCLAAA